MNPRTSTVFIIYVLIIIVIFEVYMELYGPVLHVDEPTNQYCIYYLCINYNRYFWGIHGTVWSSALPLYGPVPYPCMVQCLTPVWSSALPLYGPVPYPCMVQCLTPVWFSALPLYGSVPCPWTTTSQYNIWADMLLHRGTYIS